MMMTLDEAKEFLEESLEKDLKTLTPKEKVNLYLSLMEYFKPKQNRVNYDAEHKDTEIIELRYDTKGNESIPRDTEQSTEG